METAETSFLKMDEVQTGAETFTVIILSVPTLMIATTVFYPNPNAKPFLVGISCTFSS